MSKLAKRKRKLIIGVTGGIATGKSAVLAELKRLGVPGISSDDLAHQCLSKSESGFAQVVTRFGQGIRRRNGEIDRRRLGQIVFSKPAERKWLERVIHPWVIRRLNAFARKHQGIIALDIPLLYEAKLENLVDVVIVVWCSRRLQVTRMMRRDRLSRPAAMRRLGSQMSLLTKRKRAGYTIRNETNRMALRGLVRATLRQIQENA